MVESNSQTSNTLFRTTRDSTWGTTATQKEALDEMASSKLVIFGEKHGNNHVVDLQTSIQQRLIEKEGQIAVVMEQFSFEM